MQVIREASKAQMLKDDYRSGYDAIQVMQSLAASCKGECNDCDHCGGSITH